MKSKGVGRAYNRPWAILEAWAVLRGAPKNFIGGYFFIIRHENP